MPHRRCAAQKKNEVPPFSLQVIIDKYTKLFPNSPYRLYSLSIDDGQLSCYSLLIKRKDAE